MNGLLQLIAWNNVRRITLYGMFKVHMNGRLLQLTSWNSVSRNTLYGMFQLFGNVSNEAEHFFTFLSVTLSVAPLVGISYGSNKSFS